MEKFSRFLLVCDYDHTLTDHTGHVPQANIDALLDFTAHGGVFTVCSGRSLPAARHLVSRLPVNAPLLFGNGAGCYDLQKEHLLFCHSLPQQAAGLIRWCDEAFPDLHMEVHTMDRHYCFHEDPHRDGVLTNQYTPFTYNCDPDDIPHPWVKAALYEPGGGAPKVDPASRRGQYFRDAMDAIMQKAGPGYAFTLSMPGLIEMQAAGTSKGLAARQLAKALGRQVLMCVGDAPNDISMLDAADLAFWASDGDSRMADSPYTKAAPSHEGTVADVIRQLENMHI